VTQAHSGNNKVYILPEYRSGVQIRARDASQHSTNVDGRVLVGIHHLSDLASHIYNSSHISPPSSTSFSHPPLSNVGLVRQRHTIRDTSVGTDRVVAKAGILVLRLSQIRALHLQKRRQLAPPIVSQPTSRERHAQRQRALVEDEVDVRRGRAGEVVGAARAGAVERGRGVDDFHVEAGAEGLHVGDDEGAVRGHVGVGHDGGELGEAEGGEDAHDVGVVGEEEVEGLVEGKGDGVVVEGDVDLGDGRVDGVFGEEGDLLLDEADADASADGGLEGVVACEVDVDAVLVAFPLLVCEELAEVRVAERNLLVGAERLRVVCVGDGPVEARGSSVEAGLGVLEVDTSPHVRRIRTCRVHNLIGVWAVVVAGERVVPSASATLNVQDERGVLRPAEAEEAGHKVLGRLHHTIFGGGASDDLAAVVVVEVAVHVLV